MLDSLLENQDSQLCNLSKCHERVQQCGWCRITKTYNGLYSSSNHGSFQITVIKLLLSDSCLFKLMKYYSPSFLFPNMFIWKILFSSRAKVHPGISFHCLIHIYVSIFFFLCKYFKANISIALLMISTLCGLADR